VGAPVRRARGEEPPTLRYELDLRAQDGSNSEQVDRLITQSAAVRDAQLSQLRAKEVEAAEKVRAANERYRRLDVSERTARLDGLRVLIVEDELIVAMELEALLRDLGCIVFNAVPSIKRALNALREERPDVAVLDVNLRGEWVTPVAEALQAEGIRFVLVTGYGSERLHEKALQGATRLRKPFDARELSVALAEATAHQRRR
jgi:CheY-like chemotaxis protein